MIVRTIWYQYPQDYDGQYMPNIQEAVDEYMDDGNPDYFEAKLQEAKEAVANGEITAFQVINLHLSERLISDAFKPVVAQAAVEPVDG